MNAPDKDTYVCEHCGGTFDRGWTEEEALEEAANNFPGLDLADAAQVCDDCFKKMPIQKWRKEWPNPN